MATTLETAAQVVSALATAAAAMFAAQSARSASQSAKEMQEARELSSAPLLTITPKAAALGYYLDLSNGYGTSGAGQHLHLENHGNGPATNISIFFEIETPDVALDREVLVAEGMRTVVQDKVFQKTERVREIACYVDASGIRWAPSRHHRDETEISTSGEQQLVSLAVGEGEFLTIPEPIIRHWFLRAVAYNHRGDTSRIFLANLTITATFDTMLRRAQQRRYRFRLNPAPMPALAIQREYIGGGGARYEFTLSPAPLNSGA